MTDSNRQNPKPRSKRLRQIAFVAALLAVIALLIWLYRTPTPSGEETFNSLQSNTEEKSSLAVMEDMWENHPGHGPVALELANLYLDNGQYQKAIEFYRKFLQIDTSATGWEVRLDISRALSAMQRNQEAVAELQWILERHPDNAGALYNLGAIEANSGHYSLARKAWEQLIAKHPQDTLAQYASASLPKLDRPDGHP
jgi:tetratricopeptide (TPR) repeat protein